jgi:hypothetical protein
VAHGLPRIDRAALDVAVSSRLYCHAKARHVDFLEGPFRSEKWNRFNFAVKPRLEHGNKTSNTVSDSSWQQAVTNLAERYFP